MKTILNFLTELENNNHREWFNDNKARYQQAKNELEQVVENLIQGISSFDDSVAGLLPKNCVFRIYRDVRFSKDKRPYKTNMGAYMARGGRKGGYAGYYLHIENGNSFLAGGIYQPQSPVLKKLRTEIYEYPKELKDIIFSDSFRETFGQLYGEKLKTAPRGFPKDFADIDLLRHKHYVATYEISNDTLLQEDFALYALRKFEIAQPLVAYINYIIDEN